jgi:hypothetical protein
MLDFQSVNELILTVEMERECSRISTHSLTQPWDIAVVRDSQITDRMYVYTSHLLGNFPSMSATLD